MVILIATIIVNVIQMAPFKDRTTVKSKQAPVTQFQGVKPNMEETTVDPVMLLLAITAPFHNANVSVHQKNKTKKSFSPIGRTIIDK